MKFLQDLVPGCSKVISGPSIVLVSCFGIFNLSSVSQVTGKAVMLDEIINYVQSLQRQVEVQNAGFYLIIIFTYLQMVLLKYLVVSIMHRSVELSF